MLKENCGQKHTPLAFNKINNQKQYTVWETLKKIKQVKLIVQGAKNSKATCNYLL